MRAVLRFLDEVFDTRVTSIPGIGLLALLHKFDSLVHPFYHLPSKLPVIFAMRVVVKKVSDGKTSTQRLNHRANRNLF